MPQWLRHIGRPSELYSLIASSQKKEHSLMRVKQYGLRFWKGTLAKLAPILFVLVPRSLSSLSHNNAVSSAEGPKGTDLDVLIENHRNYYYYYRTWSIDDGNSSYRAICNNVNSVKRVFLRKNVLCTDLTHHNSQQAPPKRYVLRASSYGMHIRSL